MTPPVVLRVRIDAPSACSSCAFNRWTDASNEATKGCALADDRDTPSYAPAPSWCPLRSGPVTVEREP